MNIRTIKSRCGTLHPAIWTEATTSLQPPLVELYERLELLAKYCPKDT